MITRLTNYSEFITITRQILMITINNNNNNNNNNNTGNNNDYNNNDDQKNNNINYKVEICTSCKRIKQKCSVCLLTANCMASHSRQWQTAVSVTREDRLQNVTYYWLSTADFSVLNIRLLSLPTDTLQLT